MPAEYQGCGCSEAFVPDLGHLRRKTRALRLGSALFLSAMLGLLVLPNLVRQVIPPERAKIPLFKPIRDSGTAQADSGEQNAFAAAQEALPSSF